MPDFGQPLGDERSKVQWLDDVVHEAEFLSTHEVQRWQHERRQRALGNLLHEFRELQEEYDALQKDYDRSMELHELRDQQGLGQGDRIRP